MNLLAPMSFPYFFRSRWLKGLVILAIKTYKEAKGRVQYPSPPPLEEKSLIKKLQLKL